MQKSEAKTHIGKLVQKYQALSGSGGVDGYNEAQTRNEFIEPLFQFLGWDMRNLDHTNEVTTEEQVSKGRVDLAFRINGIPIMFLEAKSMRVNLDEWKWAEQAINYSWNKSVTWAVLTDFEAIKIFNAEVPPKNLSQNLFFELRWDEYIDRFDQLWLLSKESFEQGLLAKEAEKWGKLVRRKQVGEQLFEDLTIWRDKLAKEFSKHTTLSEEELDEGVQRVLDRLIFIRAAEDRKIEQNILLSVLREWESSGKKHNIFKRLIDGFRWFDENYNSKLFSPHAVEKWEADNGVFVEIINGLYETNEGYRYDFSAISADILGGIYEQYLGFVQEKEEKSGEKSKRKSQGIYYTPKYIVDYLVKNTVGQVVEKATKKELQHIRILDPACGSGSFLIAAFDGLLEAHEKQGTVNLFTKFDILKENLYGVDLDEQAVEIAQLNLLLKVLAQRTILPTLKHNLRSGNSLIEGAPEQMEATFGSDWRTQRPFNWNHEFPEVFESEGFDAIIGNPPYVFARGKSFTESVKKYYYENYELASYQLNTYLLFIDKAYRLLKKGGWFGFIIPNTWLTIDTFAPLRKFLLESVGNLQIINIYDKVFDGANVDTCMLIFHKGRRSQVTLGEFRDGKLNIVGKLAPDTFKSNNYIINISLAKSGDSLSILKKIESHSKPLSTLATVKAGLKAYETGKGIPAQTDEMKNERVYHSKTKIDDSYVKYLEGKDVKRYAMGWKGWWLKYGKCLAAPRDQELFTSPRILVRQIPSPPPYSINAVYTETYLLNDINSMIILDFQIDPLFLLSVLNSRVMTFWFAKTFDKFQRKTFPQFKVKELALFPIPNATEAQQKVLAKKAQMMLDLNKELQETSEETDKYSRLANEISQLNKSIDSEVCSLFGLSNDEMKMIEAEFPSS